CSAVETARLLLVSRLGNDQVGKNLVFSLETAGAAAFAFPSEIFARADDAVPFLNVSLQDRYADRDAPGWPRAGTPVLERPHPNPIQHALRVAGGGLAGPRLVAALRRHFLERREIVWESFVEMLPRPGARVELDPDVVDAAGVPVARIVLDSRPDERPRAA